MKILKTYFISFFTNHFNDFLNFVLFENCFNVNHQIKIKYGTDMLR